MSFIFSKVIITHDSLNAPPFVRYEGGFLDEFDVYDKMRRDPAYAKTLFTGDEWRRIRVEQYRFFSGEARERPADGDHFAMMRAYDELAAQCGAKPFMDRDEIQYLGCADCTLSSIRERLYRQLI